MEYKSFLEILMNYKKASEDISELHDIGVDLLEGKYKLSDRFHAMLEASIGSHYNEEGLDWVNWFIFENNYGNKVWDGPVYSYDEDGKLVVIEKEEGDYFGAKDENGDPIFHSYESAWEYLEKNCKL
jgi:hypothetical protein